MNELKNKNDINEFSIKYSNIKKYYDFSIGEPHFNINKDILEEIKNHLHEKCPYSNPQGLYELRKKPSLLYRIVACYQILEYQRSEKWDYLILIDKISGDYTVLDSSKFNQDNVNSYDILYDNKHLGFGKGIISNDTRSKAIGLVYKK